MRKKKETFSIVVEITTKFEPYKTKKLNRIAHQEIKDYIMSSISDIGFVPMYVEELNGVAIEDITDKVKVKKFRP